MLENSDAYKEFIEQLFRFNTLQNYLQRPEQLDAFGNQRTSSPMSLFDTQFQYIDFDNLTWNKKVSGTASITHLPNESSIRLNVGNTNGDHIIWQSKRYIRYQAGKSQKIMMTSVLGDPVVGRTKRNGYFDADNGIFFEQTGTTIAVVLRSKTTGVVVENRVLQADWNYDKMDGTGPSGITLDSSKSQILFIDLEWLSVGRVRVGFVIGGTIHYVHFFDHANITNSAYMTTANLPIRYEVFNTADTAESGSIKAICCSVQSEGGFVEEGYFPSSANNGITPIIVTTRRPILSIRPKATFNDIVNRGDINPLDGLITTSSNNALVEIVAGGTLSGGAGAWISAGDHSIVEYNVDRTGITGGRVVESFYVTAGTGQNRGSISDSLKTRVPLTLDIDGNNPVNLSIVVTSLGGNASVLGAMNWREIF